MGTSQDFVCSVCLFTPGPIKSSTLTIIDGQMVCMAHAQSSPLEDLKRAVAQADKAMQQAKEVITKAYNYLK